jgi:transcription elongation factor GreA-like protein
MKRILLCLLLVTPSLLFSADQSDWTDWLPAKNVAHADRHGNGHAKSKFVYRWRVSTACGEEDCSIDLQIRNNADKRKSINYTYSVEKQSGSVDSDKDHRNFDPHEVQEIPVSIPGCKILEVRTEEI